MALNELDSQARLSDATSTDHNQLILSQKLFIKQTKMSALLRVSIPPWLGGNAENVPLKPLMRVADLSRPSEIGNKKDLFEKGCMIWGAVWCSGESCGRGLSVVGSSRGSCPPVKGPSSFLL